MVDLKQVFYIKGGNNDIVAIKFTKSEMKCCSKRGIYYSHEIEYVRADDDKKKYRFGGGSWSVLSNESSQMLYAYETPENALNDTNAILISWNGYIRHNLMRPLVEQYNEIANKNHKNPLNIIVNNYYWDKKTLKPQLDTKDGWVNLIDGKIHFYGSYGYDTAEECIKANKPTIKVVDFPVTEEKTTTISIQVKECDKELVTESLRKIGVIVK